MTRPNMTPDALAALSRRGFLKTAGALIVGFSMNSTAPKARGQGTPAKPVTLDQVDSWVAIAKDETVTGYSGKCDFGQGFRTVQIQLIAEELSVPLERVNLIFCDTALTPDQGVTSGSQSSPTEFGPNGLRQALATAREALFQMAADALKAPMDQLTVEDGVIMIKSDSSKRMSYGQLVGGRTFNLTVNSRALPRDPATYKILGTSVPRHDIPEKVTGQYQYVQNVRLPGMLHGKVVRPPFVGAKLDRADESSLKGLPGNPKLVVKGDFVGIVADKEYYALQAVGALDIIWTPGPALPAQATFYDYMRRQPSRDAYTVLAPDVDQNLKSASKTVNATYLHPYQLHGSLASSCAVADVRGGTGANATATIWSATQGVTAQRDSVANVLGIPNRNIRVIFVEGSGCYGCNGNDTVSFDAAILSQAVGKPVRVQLTRKDEMAAGENYGPAAVVDLRAGLDDKGTIVAWDFEAWTLSKGGRPNANTPGNIVTGALVGMPTPPTNPAAANPPANYGNNSNAASSYGAGIVAGRSGGTGNITSERVLTHTIASPFFTGPLRSPNRLQNTFANESFMDELAAAAKADPVQFRLRHLADPRLIDVLNAAAKAANWEARVSPKAGNPKTGKVTGRGIACVLYEGDNGYAAMVAEVEVNQDTGEILVKRLAASQDSGPVSNPDGLRNQMEGGALQGMSRALREEVTWDSLRIRSIDWRTYNIYRFGEDVPLVETVLVNRLDKPQMGAGECTITLSAAAIGNAVFDATGARLRQVPFTPDRVLAALKARS